MIFLRFRTIPILPFLNTFISTALFIATCSVAWAQSGVLAKRISLKLDDVTLEQALDRIEGVAGCTFIYSLTQLDADRTVSLNYANESVEQILRDLFGDAVVRMEVKGNRISLQPSAGKGVVSGTVRTSDGQPAGFVTVGIRGQRSTQADGNGHFELPNVEAGQHTVTASYVGLRTQQKKVSVTNGGTTSVTFTLTEDAQTLQEVIVHGEAINQFADRNSTYIAKLPITNLENPQVYSVVHDELLKEQSITNFEHAHQNIPGVMTMMYSGGSTGIVMRGFLTNGRVKNGMDMIGIGPRDPVTIERIEAIKGPSGTLFGSLSTTYGGLINYVTKKPHEHLQAEASLSAGSWGLNRGTADVNVPLNSEKTLLARVNVGAHSENSFRDQGFDKSYIVAPVITYRASPRLLLTLETEFIGRHAQSPYTLTIGSKVTGNNFKDLPWEYRRSLIGNGITNKTSYANVFAQAEYQLSANWTSQTAYAWSEGAYALHHSSSLTWQTDSTISRAFSIFSPDRSATTQLQQHFTGDFKLGGLRNRMVVGINYTGYYQYRLSSANAAFDTVNVRRDVLQISRPMLEEWGASRRWNAVRTLTNMYSLYASDVVNLSDRLMAMLSLRMDRYANEGNYNVATGKAAEDFSQTTFSPKFGLVYQPLKDRVSLFANYINGFRNVAPMVQPDGTTSIFRPQYANQMEGGIKLDIWRGKLNATINYYHIKVTNATRPEVVGDLTFTVQDGTQLSKGFEVDIVANPLRGLNIIAGYGYNDNRFTKSAANIQGKRSPATPANLANVWVSYTSISGIGIGVGGNHVDESYYNSTNTFVLPGYTLLNGTVFFDKGSYRISLKGNNLLNESYWDTTGNPQRPANFLAGITYRF